MSKGSGFVTAYLGVGAIYGFLMGLTVILELALVGIAVVIGMVIATLISWRGAYNKASEANDRPWMLDIVCAPLLGLTGATLAAMAANPHWHALYVNTQVNSSSAKHQGWFWLLPFAFVAFCFALYGTFATLAKPRSNSRTGTNGWLRFSSYAGFLIFGVYFGMAAVVGIHNLQSPLTH